MQTQDFYNGSAQPSLHPLSFSFNPELEVPLIQGFQIKPSINTIGLWFQSTLLALSILYNFQEIPYF